MKKIVVLFLLVSAMLNIYCTDYSSVQYKTADGDSWSADIPMGGGEEQIVATLDGVNEIPTTHSFVEGSPKNVDVLWTWDYEDADSFSYRMNVGKWNRLSGDQTSAKINNLKVGKFHLFDIFATKGGVDSPVRSYGIVATSSKPYSYPGSIRVSFAPYSLAIIDFYNGHDISSSEYLSLSKYGVGADFDLGFYLFNRIRLGAGIGYSLALKKTTVIPDAFDVHYIKAYGSLDVVVFRKGAFSASAGISGGKILHINANKYNDPVFLGARIDFGYRLCDSLALSAGTKLTASHLPSSEPLLMSMTYLVDPVVISAEVRF